MSALLRDSNRRSTDATKQWFRIDRMTVGVADLGGPVIAIYRWEFNLFEGVHPSARGFTIDVANTARHMGLSISDYLAAPGSATSRAHNESAANRAAAVRAADVLLHALRQLRDARDDGMSYDMRDFLTIDNTQRLDQDGLLEPSAYACTKTALLSILTRLAHGDETRAMQVYTDVYEHGRTISHVLRSWEQRWFEEDYTRHVRRA